MKLRFDNVVKRTIKSLRYGFRAAVVWSRRIVLFLWRLPLVIKLKIGAVAVIVIIVTLTPPAEGGAETIALPTDGTPVEPSKVLEQGKLYKLIVTGTYVGGPDGKRADAQFRTSADPFDTPNDAIEVDGELLHADLLDKNTHTYTYYIPGRGRRISIRLIDRILGGAVEGGYLDNEGCLEMTLVEADFRFTVSDEVNSQLSPMEFSYTLDPIPRENDVVTIQIFRLDESGRKVVVFEVDSNRYLDDSQGSPNRLTKRAFNNYTWNGYGNSGSYTYRRPGPGIYYASLTVRSGDDEFTAFPPDVTRDYLKLAIIPSDADPRNNATVALLEDDSGKPYFPYYSPRARHPILGPIKGLDGIYVRGEDIEEPSFLYYGETNYDGEPIISPAVLYTKRMINLALSTADESDNSYRYEAKLPVNGTYDDDMVAMLAELRTRLPYDTEEEWKMLSDIDNLPPEIGIAADDEELGRIVGAPTVEHLLNLEYEIKGFPVKLPIREFDNFKAYDPDDPYHSLYHTIIEVGTRINGETRRFSPPPTGPGNIVGSKNYDISDDDFIALIMAVCYQECGFVHTTKSGVIYRAGRGRGSATGYMQSTKDVIFGTAYKITYPTADGLVSTRLNRLPSNSKYAVRNVARFNIEIGSAFLREMVNQPHYSWHKDIKKEMRGAGNLSFATETGTVNRVKLTGAMYNAGPGSMKVMIHEIYDDPDTPNANEGVDLFVDEYECDVEPFLERFRADLADYADGKYKFPIQKKGAAGNVRLSKLIHWLGPYWHKKKAPISWEEAALMKLDIEVIPYVQGLKINFIKFRDYGDYYFKNTDFSGLWQRPRKRKEEVTATLKPFRGVIKSH
ncbi:MAG: lytic transglycosylase domain-containing protein [bacterium]|nr:lytic transglycosylase domain-containing protein [bacterium]